MADPATTGPQTLEEWRDQALFQARLVAQLNRDCFRLHDAIRAVLTGAAEPMDGNLVEPMVLVRQSAFARLCEIEKEVMQDAAHG